MNENKIELAQFLKISILYIKFGTINYYSECQAIAMTLIVTAMAQLRHHVGDIQQNLRKTNEKLMHVMVSPYMELYRISFISY